MIFVELRVRIVKEGTIILLTVDEAIQLRDYLARTLPLSEYPKPTAKAHEDQPAKEPRKAH